MPDPKDTSKTQRIKKILWESTLNAPIRGAYNLMNTSYDDLVAGDAKTTERIAGDSLEAAGGVTAGSAFVPKPRGAVTMGANRGGGGPHPAKRVGPKSMRQKTLDDLKQGPKMPVKARGVEPGGARATFLKDAKTRAGVPTRKARPGEKAFIGPMNKPKAGEKGFIGPSPKPQAGDKKFIGPVNKPKPGGKNFIGPERRVPQAGDKDFIGPQRKAPQAGDKDFIGPQRKVPKSGDKDFIGPTRPDKKRTFGNKMKAGAAAGAGLLGYASYRNADKPKAEKKEAPRDDRASQLTSKSDKAAEFRKKQQGMKVEGSPTNPDKSSGTKKAGDKSRAANKPEKKMSNFERMKQRQYEKEGYGGRSMTSKGAKERVKTERGFKFKDLFKKK